MLRRPFFIMWMLSLSSMGRAFRGVSTIITAISPSHQMIPSTFSLQTKIIVRGVESKRLPLSRYFATSSDSTETPVGHMANLYQEWSLEQDQQLWEYRNESVSTIAARLGRGLRGVETRLAKLKDPSSNAYGRLFSDDLAQSDDIANAKKPKFVPASEVLRRIQWDASLPSQDFSILYYDRVEDEVLEAPFDAPNTSIKGKATNMIDALPEHRITGIKYRDQVVWDRERRLDLVFSGPGIARVIETYEAWKQARDAEEDANRKRQAEVSHRLQNSLGIDRFTQLKELSREIQTTAQREDNMLLMLEVEQYVQSALRLFRNAREDPSSSPIPSLIAMNDYEALDQLSEIVALLPDTGLKPIILTDVSRAMKKVEGKPVIESQPKALPEISEADLVETFVRGSGPGGQKVSSSASYYVTHEMLSDVRSFHAFLKGQ